MEPKHIKLALLYCVVHISFHLKRQDSWFFCAHSSNPSPRYWSNELFCFCAKNGLHCGKKCHNIEECYYTPTRKRPTEKVQDRTLNAAVLQLQCYYNIIIIQLHIYTNFTHYGTKQLNSLHNTHQQHFTTSLWIRCCLIKLIPYV